MNNESEANANKKGKFWPVVLILVVGFAGYLLGRASNSKTEGLATVVETDNGEVLLKNKTAEDTENAVLGESENLILVSDQISGNKVLLERLVLKRDGWVVVHDFLDGVPGRILGASSFKTGETKSAVVNLVRSTEAGKKYLAMIHVSNGDQEFQFRVGEPDGPLTDVSGKPIMMEFKALAP